MLGAESPTTLHDFFGFPAPLYALRYAAPGASRLAHDVVALLREAGFNAELDLVRGFDHGVWAPLMLMYPEARIPVTQISINARKSPYYHWRLGRVLGALRGQGVLVLGSGAVTHNLRDCVLHDGWPMGSDPDYVRVFSAWVAEQLRAGQIEALLAYRERAPNAVCAHPTDEHLLPLFAAMGAAGVAWTAERVHHSVMHRALAIDHFVFNASSGIAGPTVFS